MLQHSVVNALILESHGDEETWFTGTEILIQTLRIERQKIEKIEHQNLLSRLNNLGGKGKHKGSGDGERD